MNAAEGRTYERCSRRSFDSSTGSTTDYYDHFRWIDALFSMPFSRSDAIHSRVVDQLDPHSSSGARAALADVVDVEALEHERYDDVLAAVDARLSRARYSLLSMLLAGIYFGLLVGYWLIDFASLWGMSHWIVPVLLVSLYAGYSTHQRVTRIRQLSEARALVNLLTDLASDKT